MLMTEKPKKEIQEEEPLSQLDKDFIRADNRSRSLVEAITDCQSTDEYIRLNKELEASEQEVKELAQQRKALQTKQQRTQLKHKFSEADKHLNQQLKNHGNL